jgi:O-Antigen ligase
MQDMNHEHGKRVGIFRFRALWLLLLLYLVGSSFLPMEIVSIGMLITVLFFMVDPFLNQKSLLFPGIGFFALIMLIGLLGFPGNAFYDVAKDAWYVGNAGLTLLFGYMMMRRLKDLVFVLQAFAAAAFIVSIVHIGRFILNPEFLQESFTDIRAQITAGYVVTIIGTAVALGDIRFHLGVLSNKIVSSMLIGLCLLSVFFSFSRTMWVTLLTSVVILLSVFKIKTILRTSIALGCVMILFFVASGPEQSRISSGEDMTFLGKMLSSLQELKVSEYTDPADINTRWRGFEAYRALQTYASGAPFEFVFGQGFGTNVALGFVMTLAGEEFDSIPVLHNGYLYLLVKTGLAGLAAYLLYLFKTLRIATRLTRHSDSRMVFSGFMLAALVFIVLESTMVISGLLNKSWFYPATVLMGVLLGYAKQEGLKNGIRQTTFVPQ